ncbi:hypothetical protein B7755_007825 [Streptomyces sp. NBS 14/10]|uniref:hypothetical protein n=1 Tax=Streptomyces sp. NBS 14/10 TaxID=1945643 RepID=UPI000B7F525A|nr:hypothetical protein [Streptomyces sp. NBS 14/10]KAK1178059.1 hypothetical protein B7755_007825 [Streptomyces sp. NBS 14/10]NUP42460.1 hypothetical protein [Streptomyces sp.]NUS83025.1 hypothetical protein [Streptomyces sp.]
MGEDFRQLITRHQLRGIRAGGLVILVTLHIGSALPGLLGGLGAYPHPWIPLAAYGLLTLILGGSVVLGLDGRPWPRGWVPCALAGTFVASVATTSQVPADQYFVSSFHWSYSLAGWFTVVLLGHRGPLASGACLGAHLAVTVALLLTVEVPSRSVGASMALSVLSAGCFQMTIAAGAKLLLDSSAAIGEALRAQERVRTRIAVARQIQTDQRRRYAELNATVLPLLTGLASGSLDPEDDEVRRACALEAARLRRLFAESDCTFDPLVHEMRACIDVAERNGTTVQLAVRGDPLELPLPLRRALLDPVIAALAAAGQTARVTVVRGGDQVRVGVVVDALRDQLPEPVANGIRVRTVHAEDRLLVEAACRITARPELSDRPEPPWPPAWPSWSPAGRRSRT